MRSIELVVGTTNGYTVIPLTLAWANMLKANKNVDSLKVIAISHGVNWDTVMYAQIECDDPDNGFEIHNLLDR
jgi:hypothetical protein